jgi:predicted aspartyl protease
MIAGFMAAASPAAAAAEDCTLKELADIDLSYDRAGGPLIPVTIDGTAKSMLVDTGSIFSGVTEQTVADLHLRQADLPIAAFELADGKRMDRAAVLPEFSIGHMRARNLDVLVIPQSEPGANGWAGTIGPDIMTSYDVEFDFGGGKFALFSHDHCPGEVVYWTKEAYAAVPIAIGPDDNHIRLTAMLDGKPVNVLIDTGTSTSAMNFSTARALFGIAPDDPALVRLLCLTCGPDSPQNGAVRYPFKTLSFGGVTVHDPKINLYPDTLKGLGTDERNQMLVGMTILRQLHLYIAYREKTLYVTGANVH